MIKYRVIFTNYKGNFYSFFVKSDSEYNAIHNIYDEKIRLLNIDLSDYDIIVNWK